MNNKKKNVIIFIMAILIWILIGVIVFLVVSLKNKTKTVIQIEPTPIQQQQTTLPITQLPTPTPTLAKEQNQTNLIDGDLDYSFLKLENKEKNKIYSPLSIKYALKMLEEGAKGNTKLQIQSLTRNLDLTEYSSIENIISLANCTYIRDTYRQYVREDFRNTLINKYNAEINYDSFTNARNINKWIEDKTFSIIKNMIEDSIVQNPNTKMLLINALAIDMEWQDGFSSSNTKEQDFTLANGSTSKVSMMKKETSSPDVSYYKDNNITALSMDLLKYDDVQLEFTAIMPNSNLKEYVNNFSNEELINISKQSTLASNTKDGLKISIPRFSFEYDLGLKEDLKSLGITEAFDEVKADFTNMTSNPEGLYVSDALHKARIEFTEKGIKAAAVTAMVMAAKGAIEKPKQPVEITIDKPFLFTIRDKSNGEIWFIGTVYEPELWKDTPKDYTGWLGL